MMPSPNPKSRSKPRPKINLSRRWTWRRIKKGLTFALLALIAIILTKLTWNLGVRLPANVEKPVDGILVLGGSIRREIYVSELAKIYPDLPIIISRGSDDPCIFQIFQHKKAPMNNVLLENCAHSTFDNFVFSVPLLKQKKVHKVRVITSPTHLPRAKYLAQIHLNAQGIAMEIDTAKETGVPGNRESRLKTTLDVTRSLMWVLAAQVIELPCFSVVPLPKVDLAAWEEEGFRCERQGQIKLRDNRKPQPKN